MLNFRTPCLLLAVAVVGCAGNQSEAGANGTSTGSATDTDGNTTGGTTTGGGAGAGTGGAVSGGTTGGPIVVEDFHAAYTSGSNNALGYAHSDNGAFLSAAASGNVLTLVTKSGTSTATWTTNLAQAQNCMDASQIASVNFTLTAPKNAVMALRLSARGDNCAGNANTQDFYVPYTSVTGKPQAIVVPLSHYGITNVKNVTSLTFANLSASTTYQVGPITLTPGLGPQSISPPSTGTSLDLPDPNFGDGSGSANGAQWAYDSGSYAGSDTSRITNPPFNASNPAWDTIQTYMTAGQNQWMGALRMTNRPYAVSGESEKTDGDGDKFKIYSLQTFGAGTYTWRVYTPLNVNSVGGERNSTAAWLFMESSQASYPPEIDIECGYSDSDDIRTGAGANANQTVCQFTVVDGSGSGLMANNMPVQGDAWHTMQMVLSDDGSGYFNVTISIDGNAATWPSGVSSHATYFDTKELSPAGNTATGGGYKTGTVKFNAMFSMEHYNWMASQNALTYNTSYIDWFNFRQ